MEAAVVSAAHGVMASLLGKLGDLLTDKFKLTKDAKGHIMFLKAELNSMYAFLKRMSDTEDPNEQDKCWAKEVRELSYDIEDSVNEFLLRVERESNSKPRGFKGFIDRIVNLMTTAHTRYQIAKEFQGLKRRVLEVSERRTRYKVDEPVSKPNNQAIDFRLLALYAEAAGLVGMDKPRDELIQLMSEEAVPAHQLKVLSIVGFGGLGKTTLANQIYQKLEGQFQSRAFVSVSQKPNIRKIMRTILSQVGFVAPEHTNMETWEENELITELRKFLSDKRYCIVIDDIWDASAWDIITCALPENKNNSRVIVTTRVETVATACCADHPEFVYKMKPLSDQDSRRLFFKRVFGSDDACPPYLMEVSGGILKRCGGLPLAIITISSLLATQPNKLKAQWEHVRRSLGSNLEVNPSLEGMRQILNLSYINLPNYLKTCMLYLAIYPEDYTIDKNDLARQWVAEGFIIKEKGTDAEDVAKSYFNELINRSMIQPTGTKPTGEVMSCRVHDMMLDLILHKSREENFITVIDDMQDMTGHHANIRRLSLHLDGAIDDRVVGSVQIPQIRTLARFGTSSYLPHFLLFKHLRALAVEISKGSRSSVLLDFTGICHLFQLRYVKIVADGDGVVLPSRIGGLLQLETFHIKTGRYKFLQELLSDIFRMNKLLHLVVPDGTILPDAIGNMKSLRTLHNFDLGRISSDSIKGLRELTNLVDLKISCTSEGSLTAHELLTRAREVMHACLENLCNLKYLDMDLNCLDSHCCLDASSLVRASFCNLQRFHAEVTFSRIPRWIDELHNLDYLFLGVKEVLDDDIGILAQLPCLTYLLFHIRGTPKDKITVGGSGFPVLKQFIVACSRISYLTFQAGAMPKLERLQLYLMRMDGTGMALPLPASSTYWASRESLY